MRTEYFPNRRSVIMGCVALTVSLAGCASDNSDVDSGDNSNDSSDDNSDANEDDGSQIEDILTIEDHEWRGFSVMDVTVRNHLEETIDLVQVEVDVFRGDERINDSYVNISGLPGGTVETREIRMDQSYSSDPCEADQYDLIPNFWYDGDQFEERYEYEFEEGLCE